ncbi:MAG TPA: histidine--tRNA ligase, partial [Gammaproteobacteria bacterium]|nr:histidine--tRNA ligase [Gammaproteobacteria bacterium]
APAAGFACGLERLIELVTLQGEESPIQSPRVFVAALGDIAELEAIRYAESLRDAGVDAQVNCGQGNLKKQLRRADNSGAQVAVIIDDESVDTSTVKMKPLRGQGEQSTVPATELLAAVRSITD